MSTLRDIGEIGAIERIRARLPAGADVIVGAGDDCAVVRPAGGDTRDWLLTSDPVIAGVHFTPGAPRAAVGRKAVGRALSDIAAMGGEPAWALVDIAAPASTPVSALDELYDGALDMARAYNLAIVGGDLSDGPVLELHVFAVGSVPSGKAVRRSGAVPGNILCVTGSLGGSAGGRHLDFDPRIEQGVWLRNWATAMIDVSDGLAADLRHLAGMSGTGCELDTGRIPIADAAAAMRNGVSALDHALHDGEDFELLFTLPLEKKTEFAAAWGEEFALTCTQIGIMTAADKGIVLRSADGRTRPLEGAGFRHFA